jgi:hypothetical protein
MSCCNIYNKQFLIDANLSSANIDISSLQSLIPEYSANTSGIWAPIIVYKSNTTLNKVDFLREAGDSVADASFDPLNCSSSTPSAPSYVGMTETGSFGCDYCNKMNPVNYNATWYLKDSNGNTRQALDQLGNAYDYQFSSDCCSGACDTRTRPDDFIPKVPVLNQNYLKKFYDFKYLNQFPASTNPGLGFNEFIKISGSNISSFSNSPDLIIDWRIKDTISEIPYDPLQSQYNNIDQHNKAYKKAKLVSNTCGNFILTQVNPTYYPSVLPYYSSFSGLIGDSDQSIVSKNIDDLLPSVDNFTMPYGFERNTYNNIFIKTKKLASYWKWNYESGVLCWYRYYDRNKINDPRPVSGVDLYISPGDVFYANNQGPEPPPVSFPDGGQNIIKPCPSGIKVIESGNISYVIPTGSSFTYISQNLYPRFIDIFKRIDAVEKIDENPKTIKEKFNLAALLCTAPEYDEITVDLMSRSNSYQYDINPYFQIDILNKDMLKGTSYGSAARLNYIKNKTDLINTLADKYGSYLWCPPNTTKTITLNEKINSSCSIQLDFDSVALSSDVSFASPACDPTIDCSQNTPSKTFAYGQKFDVGQSSLDLRLNTRTRYDVKCSAGSNTKTGSARVAGLYLNNSLLKETVYDSGCYVFQDNYPRILTANTPSDSCCNGKGTDCGNCDSDSTYNLVGGGIKLCQPYKGDLSFCDFQSARLYNNEGSVVGNRPSRQILNNSLYLKRSYPAIAFNPHIDNVAFHHQGGVYHTNSMFGDLAGTTVFNKNISSLFDSTNEGTVSLQFTTKDVGIKIYSLFIEKLRTNIKDSYTCRAFPIRDKCKCFGLSTISNFPYVCNDGGSITFTNKSSVLFTPNLSTTFSPSIMAYGGYTESKINEMFGGGDIANRIKILKKEIENLNSTIDFLELSELEFDTNGQSLIDLKSIRTAKSGQINNSTFELATYRIPNHPDPGIDLNSLDKYIDPLKPYGDEQSIGIRLNNYVTTNYTVELPAYDTVHSDIWAKVIEGVDFNLQRYTTKVLLNNKDTLYDQQKKVISVQGSSPSISVKLSNPYLEALLGGENILYPPVGSLCSKSGNFGSPGDEISPVSIEFYRIPRKQLLTFYIKPPQAMGFLKKGFFHPNSGLIDLRPADPASTSLYQESGNLYIDYDKALFNSDSSFYSNGSIYYGEINPSVQRAINQIGQFSNHRKPRLYLQLNGVWYEYNTPNLFGFYNQDMLQIGKPFIFEYLDDESKYSIVGPWLPTSPKKHIDFNYIYNYPNKDMPISYQRQVCIKDTNKPKIISIDGTRAYFYVKEEDNVTVSLSSTISSLSEDDQNAISTEKPEVLLSNGERYRYISGNKNVRSSYVISDYNYLYHNFSDLHIDYNLKNKSNYVYNTKKICNQKVVIINADKPKQIYETIIKEKKIYSLDTDEYGNKLKTNNKTKKKYLKVYTEFTLDRPLRYDRAYVDFSCLYNNFTNTEGVDSLILLRNLNTDQVLKKENDYLLNNENIQSKWGDLLDFDNQYSSELTKYFISKKYLYDVYPSSVYINNFYKTIVNNSDYLKHRFIVKYNHSNTTLDLGDIIYFNIHQKYNIDYGSYKTQNDYWNQNNYLPFMDINILPSSDNINSCRSSITNNINSLLSDDKIYSGIINISGIYKKLSTSHDWGSYKSPQEGKYFWINLDTGSSFKSALSPATAFYSDSMRIDTPAHQLTTINYSSIKNNRGCRQTYDPVVSNTNDITFNSNTFNFSHFGIKTTGSVYDVSPVYCDKDSVGSCSNTSCNITTVGTGIYSGDYSFYLHSNINTPTTTNIPYIISYDCGLYNTIGTSGVSYIQRHELAANNVLFPISQCNTAISPRPVGYSNSTLNEEYQSVLRDSIVDHSVIVKNTDTMANEMLFRLIYGEKQKINYERVDGSNSRIKLEDLFKYSHPRAEPRDIYKNIVYDLDITADTSKRKVSGNISINGVLELNKKVTVSINNIDITFTIKKDTVTGAINIEAESTKLPGGKITSKIYDTKTISKSIVVSEGAISGPGISFAADCIERGQISISLTNGIERASLAGVPSCNRVVIKPCDANGNGGELGARDGTETATFPRWTPDQRPDFFPLRCNNFNPSLASIKGEFQGGCSCGKINCVTGKASLPKNLEIYFEGYNGSTAELDPPGLIATNRGVGPVTAPSNCFVISQETAQISIQEGDNNRGSIPGWYSPCFVSAYNAGSYRPHNFITSLITAGFFYDQGRIESAIPTKLVVDPPHTITNTSPGSIANDCGICYGIDSKDPLTGKDRYNPLGRGYPPSTSSTSDACECENYTYGYCRNSSNAASCVCKSLRYEYTEFPYTFEYCKHSITLLGHKRRITGKVNPDGN